MRAWLLMHGLAARTLGVSLVLACSSDRAGAPVPRPAPTEVVAPSPAPAPIDAAVDAPRVPLTLDAALAELRARDAAPLAEVISKRVAQTSPKMRLTSGEGLAVATAVLAVLERAPVRELQRVMPRSTVELARAVAERGVPLDELDRIARYLAGVVAAIEPERLATFDDNHSHVTGREWQEIDYGGESMTWQGQRDAWAPKGVTSFKRAELIHAYFVGAERLAHWQRVYKPRGKMSSVAPP